MNVLDVLDAIALATEIEEKKEQYSVSMTSDSFGSHPPLENLNSEESSVIYFDRTTNFLKQRGSVGFRTTLEVRRSARFL